MLSRSRRRPGGIDYWPGFVDALSTLLLVVTFLMVLFMVAQYFVAQEASGKDTALARLQKQIAQMADMLSLERSQKKSALEESSLAEGDALRLRCREEASGRPLEPTRHVRRGAHRGRGEATRRSEEP